MKPKYALLYCVTILLVEYALLLLGLIAYTLITRGSTYFQPGALYGPGSLVTSYALLAMIPTACRAIFVQIPLNTVLQLFALGRLRGCAEVVWGSTVVNVGTCLVFTGIVMAVVPYSGDILGLMTAMIGASLVAPIIALRFWRRALLSIPAAAA